MGRDCVLDAMRIHPKALQSGRDPFLPQHGDEADSFIADDTDAARVPAVAGSILVHPPPGWTPMESRELVAIENYLRELGGSLRRLREEAGADGNHKTLVSFISFLPGR
eukprot:COSAG06_NODE_3693_length_4999_cov_204.219388_13_plen_109_part_00